MPTHSSSSQTPPLHLLSEFSPPLRNTQNTGCEKEDGKSVLSFLPQVPGIGKEPKLESGADVQAWLPCQRPLLLTPHPRPRACHRRLLFSCKRPNPPWGWGLSSSHSPLLQPLEEAHHKTKLRMLAELGTHHPHRRPSPRTPPAALTSSTSQTGDLLNLASQRLRSAKRRPPRIRLEEREPKQ